MGEISLNGRLSTTSLLYHSGNPMTRQSAGLNRAPNRCTMGQIGQIK
jgi:hypothetical protein